MIRRLIAIVTAASVLAHAVIGCGAHHLNGAVLNCAQATLSHGCCQRSATSLPPHSTVHDCDESQRETVESSVADSTEISQSGNSPCEQPLKCYGESCVFAAPNAPVSLQCPVGTNDWFLNKVDFVHGSCCLISYPARSLERVGPIVAGTLRDHLALRVILI